METKIWHERFIQQAGWTAQVRSYLLNKITISENARILEVGCGTGAVLSSLPESNGLRFGLDLKQDMLQYYKLSFPEEKLVQADGQVIPYDTGVFDLTYCHYLLLWVQNPSQVLREMVRVTRKGGMVAVFAEPDYGGRIDYPPALSEAGQMQVESLRKQGADPLMGRKIAGYLKQAGLSSIESGILGAEWQMNTLDDDFENEWQVLAHDLSILGHPDIHSIYQAEKSAREKQERILFIPTFYGFGIKQI